MSLLGARETPALAVWWLDPVKLLALFTVPVYATVFLAPIVFGPTVVNVDFRVYWTTGFFWLGLLFIATVLAGAWMGRQLYPRIDRPQMNAPISTWFLDLLALAAIVAYLVWFRGLFLKPWILLQIFSAGARIATREAFRTVPGLTTLTQFGIAYVIFFLDRIWGGQGAPLSRRFYFYFVILVVFGALRVFIWGERLALIELAVPAAVLYFLRRGGPTGPILRLATTLLPFIGILALLVFFGATEYFRSWMSHYQYEHVGFAKFVGKRVLTYYYTALNNGAGLLTLLDWPTYRMEYLLRWLYRFPLLVGTIFRYTFGAETGSSTFLERYADPEFNNMSGVFTVFYDVGVPGAIIVALLWGLLAGYLYNSCRLGTGVGRGLYPLLYISLLEMLRLLYLSEQRAFPAVVMLLVGYWLARERPVLSAVPHLKLRSTRHRLVEGQGWFNRVGRVVRRRT